MRYWKRSVAVEAVRWTGDNTDEVRAFCPLLGGVSPGERFYLPDGRMISRGDWIIKDGGEFSPVKDHLFSAAYVPS